MSRRAIPRKPSSRFSWSSAILGGAFLGGLLLAVILIASGGRDEPYNPLSDADEKDPVMVEMPGGTFVMGNDAGAREEDQDAKPAHEVTVRGFWMDKTEVTNGQFAGFVKATGYVTVAERKPDPKKYPNADPRLLVPGSAVFVPVQASLDPRTWGAPHPPWWQYVPGASWRNPDGPKSSIEGKMNYPVVHIAWVEGEDRRQATLLPECLDDYVTQDNPVRVIEAFIDELDLGAVGFAGVVPEATGRPAYHPATLLKVYLYGYLNRIQSSRRLERETQRNIELMWLTGRLMPDFKTIADFRRDNGPAIRAACAQFVVLCRQFNLFTRAVVAIDGSKFKAVNTRDKNFTVTKVAKRVEQVEASIARYLAALDRADRQDDDVAETKTARLKEKIEGLRRQMQSLREMGKQVEAAPDKQVSLTDPDARSMATSGKGTGIVGYNVQMAVDAEHHLIVAHEVTNVGSDRAQLTSMGQQALDATGCEEITVLADRGYYSGDEVLACEGTGILPCIPKTLTSGNAKRGLFTVTDFIYDAGNDRYTCPAGKHLTRGKVRSDRQDNIDHYRNLTACSACALKTRCTPDKHKRLKRWEHEGVLDKMQDRLDRLPNAMTIRRQTVEHPFGTLKAWMGSTHFLTRNLEKVKTEMSLQVLAYNMKRMINIFGVKPLIKAIAA